MGLDITVYEIATPTDHLVELTEHGIPTEWCDDDDHYVAFTYKAFDHSLGGLEAGRCYTSGGEVTYFRAGSYGGYGHWRSDLCRSMLGIEAETLWGDVDSYMDQPFYELINFADNEGCIGPKVAKKLSVDFLGGLAKYKESHDEEYYLELYDKWCDAFMLAADTGLIIFH